MRNTEEINIDLTKQLLVRAIEVEVEGMKSENMFASKKGLSIKYTKEDFDIKSKEIIRIAYLDEETIIRHIGAYKSN